MFKKYQLTEHFLTKHYTQSELTQLAAKYYGIVHQGDHASLIKTVIEVGSRDRRKMRRVKPKSLDQLTQNQEAKASVQLDQGPIRTMKRNKPEEIIEALKKFTGLQVKVDENHWHVRKQYQPQRSNGTPLEDKKGNPIIFVAEDSGHTSVPLRVIIEKAETVSRARYRVGN